MLNSPSFKKEFVQSVSRWMCVCVSACTSRNKWWTYAHVRHIFCGWCCEYLPTNSEKMHVYNRLIISSDGFAIILKTSIINFFMWFTVISYSVCAARAPPLVASSAFHRSRSNCSNCFVDIVFGFQDEMTQNVITHTHTFMHLRHEWFTHIRSTNNKKRIYTHRNAI